MHFVQWIYIYAKCLFYVCALANGKLWGVWATQQRNKHLRSTNTHTLERHDGTHLVNTNTAPCTLHKCFQFQFIWLSVLARCGSMLQMECLNEWQRQGMWNGIECVRRAWVSIAQLLCLPLYISWCAALQRNRTKQIQINRSIYKIILKFFIHFTINSGSIKMFPFAIYFSGKCKQNNNYILDIISIFCCSCIPNCTFQTTTQMHAHCSQIRFSVVLWYSGKNSVIWCSIVRWYTMHEDCNK